MNLLIATDSFKGSLSSLEAGKAMAAAARQVFPRALVEVFPLSDGGEGMSETFAFLTGAEMVEAESVDPLARPIKAHYSFDKKEAVAYVGLAAASGLTLLKPEEYSATDSTTFGTGLLLLDALKRGSKRIFLGLGGSATNDGGAGMLAALGCRFLDAEGNELEPCGKILSEIATVDVSPMTTLVKDVEIIACCDVQNPLFGMTGAAFVFAKQKGASRSEMELLDKGLRHFAEVSPNKNAATKEGAGAAGGVGFALSAYLGAKMEPGIKKVLSTPKFSEMLEDCDLILTGEGQMDNQSTMGKATWGLLAEAKRRGKPICAVAGRVMNRQTAIRAGFQDAISATPRIMPLCEALQPDVARCNIQQATLQMLRRLYRNG